jgi:hypothetical protein
MSGLGCEQDSADRSLSGAEGPGGEIVVYEAADGAVRVDVRLDHDTVWLTQQQMAELFGRERSVIAKHVRTVYVEGGLELGGTCANSAQVRSEGGRTQRLDR